MEKKTLQASILEKAYQSEKWLDVMKEYFNAKQFHIVPLPVLLPSNDIAESAVELGSFYTADERLVAIYEVKLTEKALIERNRVRLRNLFKSVIRYDLDAALIVYIQQDKWRFSYVSEIRIAEGKRETEPKRYTYLFGKGEICRTAADRFEKLKGKPISLNDLFEAFSVEKLNRDFFKTYKEFFENFSDHLAKNELYRNAIIGSVEELEKGWKAPEAKPIRDFVKKLLGRIVFLQFLQKKGWMGCPVLKTSKENEDIWINGKIKFLQELFVNCKNPSTFHSECLRTLFFETLNRKRTNNVFDIPMLNSETGNEEKVRVPYLNGGLFDIDISYEKKIDFPTHYFKDLLDFFEKYNFTIDENDPYDNEIGIDPEMLGHIFENLLEENREKGAFYTPKEIVHYMCQESLIEYLHNELPKYSKSDIEKLIRYSHVTQGLSNSKNATEINNKLKSLKICDPAIGSGAFPMGLLKELFQCRRLLYGTIRNNDDFKQVQIKKEIIQQNIYGVDLENGAVEIARLRFWLSLVVDEKIPHPLPNLDYKIMQGNSLLESFANIDLSNLINADDGDIVEEKSQLTFGGEFGSTSKQLTVFTKANKEHLYLFTRKYFDPDSWEKQTGEKVDKAAVKKEINDFVEGKIHAHILHQQLTLKANIKAIESKWKEAGLKDFEKLNQKSREYKQYRSWKDELDHLSETEDKLIALQQNGENKPYFLWHLWFKDVFDRGGFDIVIGNPPYINIQSGSTEIGDLEAAGYKTFARTGDIYCLFYEQGNNLLKLGGTLCYITSNKWMNAAYGKNFRKYLLEETNPILLIDFSKTVVFPSAVVFVNILQFNKEKNGNALKGVRAQADFKIGKTDLNDYVSLNSVTLSDLKEDNWTVAEKQDFIITKRIDDIGTPIKNWKLSFFRGVTTGLNEVFHISEDKKNELIREDKNSEELIRTLLRGRDIKRYKYEYANVNIIFTKQGTDIEKYPAIKNYLSQFKQELSPKKDNSEMVGRKPGTYKWFEIQDNTSYYQEFEKEKIVWIEISDRANYCIDTEGHFLTNSAYFITGENLKYLLAVLNSRLMDFYFYQKTAQIAGGRKRYTKQYVELLPIPQLTDKILLRKFELIVEYLIFLHDKKHPPVNPYTDNVSIAPVFEDVLNMMVNELYFEREMIEDGIDVLQFVTEKNFEPLSKNDSSNVVVIGKVYKWLQEQNNQIRNRIILANIKSKSIIRIINSNTH